MNLNRPSTFIATDNDSIRSTWIDEGNSPNNSSIDIAKEILRLLPDKPAPSVFPLADFDGISIEWASADNITQIEVQDNSDIITFYQLKGKSRTGELYEVSMPEEAVQLVTF